jgi:hypothetical protein
MRASCRFWILSIFLFLQLFIFAWAQDVGAKVNCGDTVEGEFTQLKEAHEYIINLSPGDKLKVGSVPIGDYLNTRFVIHEPAGKVILETDFSKTPVAETGILSGRGEYKVFIQNTTYNGHGGAAGVYTLYVSCILRDGTVIEAGVSQ